MTLVVGSLTIGLAVWFSDLPDASGESRRIALEIIPAYLLLCILFPFATAIGAIGEIVFIGVAIATVAVFAPRFRHA
jgi:hypothetical protein